MVGDKKKSGAERFKVYYKRNKASDLFKNKKKDKNISFQTGLLAKRLVDENFNRKVKEDQAKRKRESRARQKANKENIDPEVPTENNESNDELIALEDNVIAEDSNVAVQHDINVKKDDDDFLQPEEYIETVINNFKTPKSRLLLRSRSKSGGDLSDVTLTSEDSESGSSTKSTPSIISRMKFKTRQLFQGKKIRRENDKKKQEEFENIKIKNFELEEMLHRVEEERDDLKQENHELMKELMKSKTELDKLELKVKTRNIWFKRVWRNVATDGKRHFKLAYDASREVLPKGTTSDLAKTTGVNFSKKVGLDEQKADSELKKLVEKFVDERSADLPDTKHNNPKAGKKPKKYQLHFKDVLWNEFQLEFPDMECAFSTFCRYWPEHVIRPKGEAWGTCLCDHCENFNLKIRAFKRQGFLEESVKHEDVIRQARDGEDEGENNFMEKLKHLADNPETKNEHITYNVWKNVKKADTSEEKRDNTIKTVPRRVCRQVTVATLVKLTINTYGTLKEHLSRNHITKQSQKHSKIEALQNAGTAFVNVDWSQNGTMPDAGQIQNAWFAGQPYSLHPGYVVTKDEHFEFAAISEATEHAAPAIMTSLKPVLDNLIDEKNIKKIIVASDSTVSQYRNGKCVWLMQDYARSKGVTIRWLFSEAHHGKCLADGTGGRLKNTVKQMNVFNREFNINSIEDIVEILKGHTTCTLYTYTKADIEETKSCMPPKVSPLRGHSRFMKSL